MWFWGAVPTRGIQVCYLRMRCPEVQSMKTICRILQEEAEAEAVLKINTQGCIPRIQTLIENNLYPVVGVAIGVAVSQVSISNGLKSFKKKSWYICSSW